MREHQAEAGWWKGELETNVTMDAEDLLLREFLGIRTAEETAQAAAWIRSQQREDGTWANFYGGPGDLSTTIESWVALRLAGDPVDAPHLAKARRVDPRRREVSSRSRVFTRIWLALFGLWSWDELPNLPPELIFLPRWFPFNVYDFACWARQTVVPLTIVATLRPQRPLPVGIDEIRTGRPAPKPMPVRSWGGFFQRLDRVLHAYAKRPIGPLRRLAMRRAVGLDPRPPGSRRGMGRHPAAVGLFAARARAVRSARRLAGDGGRHSRPRGLPRARADAGRHGAAARSLPVAGLGHRART